MISSKTDAKISSVTNCGIEWKFISLIKALENASKLEQTTVIH